MSETIKPRVVLSDGTTYYPTGKEWLLAFAIRGCQWAIEALHHLDRREVGERYRSAPDYPAR